MNASELRSMVGLDGVVRALEALAEGRSGAQSVLLYGAEGSGKTTLSRWLAQAWICQAQSGRPCGECSPCKSAAKGNNPDLLLIEPKPPSNIIRLSAIVPPNTPDKEQTQPPLSAYFRTGPLSSRCKVAWIEDADRMNADAGNALLKMLEEPYPSQRLILTTRVIGSILPTIVSRCVCIACPSPNPHPDGGPAISAESFGRAERVQRSAEVFERLENFARGLADRPSRDALVASDELKTLAEALGEAEALSARNANAEACRLLGDCLIRLRPHDVESALAVAETHRRVLGNGNSGLAFDSLLSRILTARAKR